MKILGILVAGLLAGVSAAGSSLLSGSGIWVALLNYLGVGMIFTLLAAAVVIWRAWEQERPRAALAMRPVAASTPK